MAGTVMSPAWKVEENNLFQSLESSNLLHEVVVVPACRLVLILVDVFMQLMNLHHVKDVSHFVR